MGKAFSCLKSPREKEIKEGSMRIVKIDGTVNEFTATFSAEKLLVEYPHHILCNARDLQQCNPRPIPDKEELFLGHVYFLIPISALQDHDLVPLACKLMAAAKKQAPSAPTATPAETETVKTPLEELNEKRMGICDTEELKMAYRDHLISKSRSRSWKPRLITIEETRFSYKI